MYRVHIIPSKHNASTYTTHTHPVCTGRFEQMIEWMEGYWVLKENFGTHCKTMLMCMFNNDIDKHFGENIKFNLYRPLNY